MALEDPAKVVAGLGTLQYLQGFLLKAAGEAHQVICA